MTNFPDERANRRKKSFPEVHFSSDALHTYQEIFRKKSILASESLALFYYGTLGNEIVFLIKGCNDSEASIDFFENSFGRVLEHR